MEKIDHNILTDRTFESKPTGGYHLALIPKGKLGEASKILEEMAEFKDACAQHCNVMAIQELSDVIGAIEAYVGKYYNLTLSDLILMKEITKRAFESGHRK